MKKILFGILFLRSLKIFALDICVMTTKADPFLADRQDCTNILGGPNAVATRYTADQLLFLSNDGFTIIGVASNASATVYTLKRQ